MIFEVVRTPKHPGPDRDGDLFSVKAKAVPLLVESGESPAFALINGNSDRGESEKLCKALNEAYNNFFGQ